MRQIDYLSCYGSYMSFRKEEDRLIMFAKHGMARTTHMADVMNISVLGESSVSVELSFPVTSVTTADRKLDVTFADSSTVVFRGTAETVTELDLTPFSSFDYAFLSRDEHGSYYVVNSYRTFSKYIVYSDTADIFLMQNLDPKIPGDRLISKLIVRSREKEYTFRIQEVKHNMNSCLWDETPFDECVSKELAEFDDFASRFRVPFEDWNDDVRYAAYILWSTKAKAEGLQSRDLVLGSNFGFNIVWCFDAGFPMYGLLKADSRLALNQVIAFFEHQDELGTIPGSMDDSNMRWMFLKPPGQGMFVRKLIREMELSYDEISVLYNGIRKLTEYWQTYKDLNKDGICEYHHGNEGALDNATAFDFNGPVDSPDLTCYLVESMDCLAELAEKLGNSKIAEYWKEQADLLAKKAIDYFVDDEGLPIVRESISGRKIPNASIVPFIMLVLKNRLPQDLRKKWISILERDYLGEYGLASESLHSDQFEEDGYFRGSVFHYYTLPMVDSLYECGEKDMADKIIMTYCSAFRKSGSYECFSALSGEGQRIKSFTSTAGAFLYYCENYINK